MDKKCFERIVSGALAASMTFTLVPVSAFAASPLQTPVPPPQTVFLSEENSGETAGLTQDATNITFTEISTLEGLKSAVQAGGCYKLTQNITLDSTLVIPSGKTVVLDLGGNKLDVDDSFNNPDGYGLIFVQGTFTLQNGILDAAKKVRGVYVDAAGSFTMASGTISDGSAGRGCGVYNKGTFTLSGGTIQNCITVDDNEYNVSGGGVYNEETFTLSGGTIKNCIATDEGGGVFNQGDFIFASGMIDNCSAGDIGGGVYSGTVNGNREKEFIMSGGTIRNCTATDEGGAVLNDMYFTMEGGLIDNCKARRGGAVCNRLHDFTMKDGTIQNCTATDKGGAVMNYGSEPFTMSGGEIKGCTAEGDEGRSNAIGNNMKFCADGGTVYGTVYNSYLITSTTGATGITEFKDAVYNKSGIIGGKFATIVMLGRYSTVGEGVEKDALAYGDIDALKTAIQKAGDTAVTLTLANGMAFDSALEIPAGKNIILDLNGYTLKATDGFSVDPVNSAFIKVKGKLTLQNGTLDCNEQTRGVEVEEPDAEFTLKNATIKNGKADNGGGVYVGQGTFIMETGGKITDCKADQKGGAVSISGSATSSFVMKDGTLEKCSASWGGAVYNNAAFTMNDGIIQGCTAAGDEGKSNAVWNVESFYAEGGVVYGSVQNYEIGSISTTAGNAGTEFKDTVYNDGTLKGGKFAGEVNNAGTISNGTFADTSVVTNNAGQITNGTFHGTVKNENKGTVIGGDFGGTVNNNGTISNGIFNGVVKNEIEGTVIGGDFSKGVFVNNGGTVDETKAKITRYSLTFDPAEMTARAEDAELSAGSTLMAGTEVTVTAKTREGAEASGIIVKTADGTVPLVSESANACTFIVPGGDVTLAVKWKLNEYTITFAVNGHGTALQEQTVEYGSKVTKPEDPTAEGYTFDGWYTGEECENAFDFDTAVTGDITLYAKWTINKYSVRFETEYGTTPESETVEYGKTLVTKPELTAEGYTFGGWYTDEECQNAFDFDTAVTEDITLYAKWTEVKKPDPKPDEGDKPSTPGETEKPDETDKPSTPGEAEKPGETDKPSTPSEPEKPGETDKPSTPSEPSKPGESDKPSTPGEPEKPAQPEQGDSGAGALLVGGALVAGGVATGVIVYNVAMDVIKSALPEGAAIPETREQLAAALWEKAGKPEVAVEEGVVLTDTEKAMRWAIEKQLISAEGEDSVSKIDVLVAAYKAKNL